MKHDCVCVSLSVSGVLRYLIHLLRKNHCYSIHFLRFARVFFFILDSSVWTYLSPTFGVLFLFLCNVILMFFFPFLFIVRVPCWSLGLVSYCSKVSLHFVFSSKTCDGTVLLVESSLKIQREWYLTAFFLFFYSFRTVMNFLLQYFFLTNFNWEQQGRL